MDMSSFRTAELILADVGAPAGAQRVEWVFGGAAKMFAPCLAAGRGPDGVARPPLPW